MPVFAYSEPLVTGVLFEGIVVVGADSTLGGVPFVPPPCAAFALATPPPTAAATTTVTTISNIKKKVLRLRRNMRRSSILERTGAGSEG